MSASSTHPARPLLDSNFVPGMLTKTVLAEYRSNPDIEVDAGALKAGFAAIGCPNVGRVIDSIQRLNAEGKTLIQVGSGSIDLQWALKKEYSLERALLLQELYIGDLAHRIEPLRWLAYLIRGIDAVPVDLLPAFDMVMGALADFEEAARNATPIDPSEFDSKQPRQSISEFLKSLN
jgi:hypothetical protein